MAALLLTMMAGLRCAASEYGLARSNGGQRQRIMVAGALMLHPKIIKTRWGEPTAVLQSRAAPASP